MNKITINGIEYTPAAEAQPRVCGSRREVREMFANDCYSATRRAIVRAAAEIGKQLRK